MQPEPAVRLDIHDGVARLTFNRPQVLNAIDARLAHEFVTAASAVAGDTTIRVVVLAAAGKHFMAGGDLQALRTGDHEAIDALIVPLHEGLRILAAIDAPSIAVLHGAVAGAGVGVALSADLAIAADDTVFNLAYAKVGTSLDGGSSWALARIVGLRKSMELALLADSVGAAEALRLHLVNQVVARAELENEAEKWIHRLSHGPTRAYGQIRSLLRGAWDHAHVAQLERERAAFHACARTQDFKEGVDAFLSRRAPLFEGH